MNINQNLKRASEAFGYFDRFTWTLFISGGAFAWAYMFGAEWLLAEGYIGQTGYYISLGLVVILSAVLLIVYATLFAEYWGRTSPDNRTMQFDTPKRAIVTAPPYGGELKRVTAVELNPDGDFPFKVWVEDGSGKEEHPFYARGIEFEEGSF